MNQICGIFRPEGLHQGARQELKTMLAALRRRPDEAAYEFVDEKAGIALGYLHSPRLHGNGASRGPEWYADHETVVALAGELHRLEANVDYPASAPAAPRLAQTYRLTGQAALDSLRGRFALAIWDAKQRQLLLMRDPAGACQIFVHYDPSSGRYLFGSRLRAILVHPGVTPALDAAGLYMSLAVGEPYSPHCSLSGARRLFAGEWLQLGGSREPRRGRSWHLERWVKDELPLQEWAALLRPAMRSALTRVTNGEDRVAVFLSGPDSAFLAAALLDAGIECEAFTLVYEGDRTAYDLEWSQIAARQLGIRHHALIVTPRDITPELLVQVLAESDEVLDVSRAMNGFFLSRAALDKGLAMCLTGNDSEQLFGGVGAWEATLKNRARGNVESEDELRERFFFAPAYFDADQLRRFLRQPLPDPRSAHRISFDALVEVVPADDLFDLLQAHRLFTRMPPGSPDLGQVPGTSIRAGYRDLDLFELSQRIPNQYRGRDNALDRRLVLTEAYRDRLPLVLQPRPKLGFPSLPWHLPGYEHLEAFFLTMLTELKQSDLVRPEPIERLIERYRRRGAYSSLKMRFWLLMQLQLWLDLFVNRTHPLSRLGGNG